MLDKLIKNNPQWQFVFYGPKQKYPEKDRQFKTASWIKKIKSYRNVTFDQNNDRYTVYGIIKNFDVAIIPYNNKIPFNKYCYPMKIFEYFYFGKPVVSSEIAELKLQQLQPYLKIAKTNRTWEENINDFLKKPLSLEEIESSRQLASNNSWQNKITKVSKTLLKSR